MPRRLWKAVRVPALVLAAALATGAALHSDAPRRNSQILLIYVGARDCAPCVTWQRGLGAAFEASTEFSRLSYREVEAPTLFAVLDDEVWPAELRRYRSRIDPGMGVPMWLVVAEGQVVAQSFGASQWKQTVLPTLKALLH